MRWHTHTAEVGSGGQERILASYNVRSPFQFAQGPGTPLPSNTMQVRYRTRHLIARETPITTVTLIAHIIIASPRSWTHTGRNCLVGRCRLLLRRVKVSPHIADIFCANDGARTAIDRAHLVERRQGTVIIFRVLGSGTVSECRERKD